MAATHPLSPSSSARYRVGADEAALSLGLPEVLLGIHPGFGGTVRSVQLIGVRPALDLMLKGKPFKGARALAVGLIDELVPPASLRERAKARVLGNVHYGEIEMALGAEITGKLVPRVGAGTGPKGG